MGQRLGRERVASLYGPIHNTSRLTGIYLIHVNYTPVSFPVSKKLPSYSGFSHLPGMHIQFACNSDMPCFNPDVLKIV